MIIAGPFEEIAIQTPFGATFKKTFLIPDYLADASNDKAVFMLRDPKGNLVVTKELTPTALSAINSTAVAVTLTSAEMLEIDPGTYYYGLNVYEDFSSSAGEPVVVAVDKGSFRVVESTTYYTPASTG